jgi:hypothetical protein
MSPSDNAVVIQSIAPHSGEVNASVLGGGRIGLRLLPCDDCVTESCRVFVELSAEKCLKPHKSAERDFCRAERANR